jgi:hypothetical protein
MPTDTSGGMDWGGLQSFFGQTAGFSRDQLAQQKAEFDAQLAFAREQMEKLGIPQLQINQYLARLQQMQFMAQLAQVQGQLTGYYTPPDLSAVQGPPGMAGAGGAGGAAGGGTGGATGTGYFVGTDGRIHVGSPQGSGQAGWGSAQGTPAASGWAPGTTSSDPNVFLQPPQAAPTQAQQPAAQPQETLALGQLMGIFHGMPTEQAKEFAAQLGQQYLATAAQLQGPQNIFQLSNFLRGAQGNPNVPAYLQALAGNTGMPSFTGPGSAPPNVLSAAGLLGQLGGYGGQPGQGGQPAQAGRGWAGGASLPWSPLQGQAQWQAATGGPTANAPQWNSGYQGRSPALAATGQGSNVPGAQWGGYAPSSQAPGSATPGWNYEQTLAAMQGIANRGAQALGPGALERLSPEELQAFGSGLGAVGSSLPSFLQQYAQSRIGQTAPVAQMQLA